jgi:hypothetical protein
MMSSGERESYKDICQDDLFHGCLLCSFGNVGRARARVAGVQLWRDF